jgi:hypothetical protein
LKKFLLILVVAVVVLDSCKKDTNSTVNLTAADIANVSGQLKGSWVFPVKTLTVVDSTGKALLPSQNLPAAAFAFDGYKTVTVRPDPLTIQTGTYTVFTKQSGGIFINVTYSDGSTQEFQVTGLSSTSLTIASTQPYVYFDNGTLVPTVAVTSTNMQKLNAADTTGNLVRVVVKNDSIFSVKVYLTHAGATQLVDSLSNTTGIYKLAVPAQSGDHLKIDVLGDFLKTAINAYVDGLPINGDISASGNETVTTNGWNVAFPVKAP